MSLFEDTTVVFIVRVWIERAASDDQQYWQRIVVEHLPSGERRYFVTLNDIVPFIESHCIGNRQDLT